MPDKVIRCRHGHATATRSESGTWILHTTCVRCDMAKAVATRRRQRLYDRTPRVTHFGSSQGADRG